MSKDNHALDNAKAWLASITDMLARLERARGLDCASAEDIREELLNAPLSVLVRDGWRSPGAETEGPEEYEILLSTGGPALRIRGDLDRGEPRTAALQYQDWGTPWTSYSEPGEALLTFAREFYFGDQ